MGLGHAAGARSVGGPQRGERRVQVVLCHSLRRDPPGSTHRPSGPPRRTARRSFGEEELLRGASIAMSGWGGERASSCPPRGGFTRASPVHGSSQRQRVSTRLRGRVRSRRDVLRTRPGAERARPEGCVLRSAPCGLGDQHSTRGRRRSPRRGPRGGPCRTPLLSRGSATPRVEKGEARPGEGVGPWGATDVQEVGGSWAAGEVAGVEVAAGEVVGAEAAVPVVARGAVPGHR